MFASMVDQSEPQFENWMDEPYFYKSRRPIHTVLTSVVSGTFTDPENSWPESEGRRPWNIISPHHLWNVRPTMGTLYAETLTLVVTRSTWKSAFVQHVCPRTVLFPS